MTGYYILIGIDVTLAALAWFVWTRPSVRLKVAAFKVVWKHAECRGYAAVKDARYPGHVIIRCPEHDLFLRTKQNWKADGS